MIRHNNKKIEIPRRNSVSLRIILCFKIWLKSQNLKKLKFCDACISKLVLASAYETLFHFFFQKRDNQQIIFILIKIFARFLCELSFVLKFSILKKLIY